MPLRLKNANYPNLQRTQKASEIKNPPRKFYPPRPQHIPEIQYFIHNSVWFKGIPYKGSEALQKFSQNFFL